MIRIHGVGWRSWYFVAAGSFGYTKAHFIVLRGDNETVKLCDRHVVTDKQIKNSIEAAPKGICKRCESIMYDICTSSKKGNFGLK